MSTSHLETEFSRLWELHYPDLPLEREVKAIPGRQFRLDFAHLGSRVGVEIQGKIWHKGRHSSGAGLLKEYEKLNLHTYHGWRIFKLADAMIAPDWLDKIATTIRQQLA
jgi:hypothetical protein